MTVNDFSNEDAVRAAYDAAEWWLNHAVDTRVIFTITDTAERRKRLAALAVRIADAVMHSSERDIEEMFPQIVQHSTQSGRFDGQSDPIPESA